MAVKFDYRFVTTCTDVCSRQIISRQIDCGIEAAKQAREAGTIDPTHPGTARFRRMQA